MHDLTQQLDGKGLLQERSTPFEDPEVLVDPSMAARAASAEAVETTVHPRSSRTRQVD